MAAVKIEVSKARIQPGTERTFQVSWTVKGSKVKYIEQYEWRWYYKTSQKAKWLEGTTGTTEPDHTKATTWDPPANAYAVKFKIRATPKKTKKKVKDKKTGKEKTVEKNAFTTTDWFVTSASGTKVEKWLKKGGYDIEKYTYNPARQYPLSINISPYVAQGKTTTTDNKWCETLEVNWEFLVLSGNQKIWRTGDSTTGIHRSETEITYTGVVPDNFEKLRIVTKPTSQDTSVIAENKSKSFSGFEKQVRQVTGLSVFKYPHGDGTVMAEWTIDDDTNLEGFTYRFEALTQTSPKRWTQVETGDVDIYQYRKSSIKETITTTTRTVTVSKKYVPTKAELEAEKVVNMGLDKAIAYLMKIGKASKKAQAHALYDQYMNAVNVMRVNIDNGLGKTTDSEDVSSKDKSATVERKYWYSPEYTVPEGTTEVRVTITPTSPETSGYIETALTLDPTFSYVLHTKKVSQNSIKLSLLSGTRRTVIATWSKLDNNNTDSYEYRWSYKVNGNDSIYFSDGDTGSISHDAKSMYAQYEAGDNVKEVYFEVRPIPKHTNDYIGAWSAEVSYPFSGVPKKKINDKSLNVTWPEQGRTDKTLLAAWSMTNKTNVSGYELTWRYKVQYGTTTYIQEGETQTISDKDVTSKTYTAPSNAISAEVKVRPVPVDEDVFIGEWSDYEEYHFSVPTRSINEKSLKVSYASGTDRKLKVSFKIDDTQHVLNYTCRYASFARGVYSEPTETTVTKSPFDKSAASNVSFELEAPNEVEKLYIQVKPNDDSGNESYFIGSYSNAVEYSLIPSSREVNSIDLDLQRGSQSTVVATWQISKSSDVDSYSYKWRYRIDNVWFDGTTGSTSAETRACTYDAPALSDAVEIKITPVPKYSLAFTGLESEYVIFTMPSATIPDVPAVPTLSINKFTLTAMVDSYDAKASLIEFEIINETEVEVVGQSELLFNRASFFTEVEAGQGFRARARALNDDGEASEWSEYTGDPVYTIPLPPEGVPTVNALSATSVEIMWNEVAGATSYVIERTTKSRYFDSAPDLVEETTITSGTRAEIQGLQPKSESDEVDGQWFFRIKTVIDSQGESEWGEIASIVIGTVPDAPTTWASSSTPLVGDDVYLNWLHNSEDGSLQTAATLQLTVNGVTETHEFVTEYTLFEPYVVNTTVRINSDATVENSINISKIPVALRSTSYGGISALGANGEYTSRVTSPRISGTKLYFKVSSTTGLTGMDVPVTLSFYKENTVINEPADIVTKNSTRHIVSASQFVLSRGGVSYYLIPANTYSSGASITWKVQTKGVVEQFGKWSVERQVNVYTKPTVTVDIGSGYEWLPDDFEFNSDNIYNIGTITATSINRNLETFPMILTIHSGPTTQKPLAYILSITANNTYDDVDDTGKVVHVRAGQELYKRYIYTNERDFITLIMANEVNLDNTYSYTLTVTVNTDVGLSSETASDFVVNWDTEADIEIDSELIIDTTTAVAYLTPYCTNENGYFINNILLSVYRKEFDGGLTAIARDIPNAEGISITDPHPTLDYARYRIVATDLRTGRMFFEDLAPQEVGITDIIIQWDEEWTGYSGVDFPQELEEIPYKGSMLSLPYNVDESDSNELDVELVNYIGRKHPVSYYGTHVGQTASWKTDIAKSDKETIYALRRLAIWPGDCYVRSPSGVGYWAHVAVSFDISHLEPIVPVSLEITRVEGGA